MHLFASRRLKVGSSEYSSKGGFERTLVGNHLSDFPFICRWGTKIEDSQKNKHKLGLQIYIPQLEEQDSLDGVYVNF